MFDFSTSTPTRLVHKSKGLNKDIIGSSTSTPTQLVHKSKGLNKDIIGC